MASWGNDTNSQFEQPMDSNGQKLKVRSTTSAYTPSSYRVEIEEAADGFRRALKVKGAVEVEQSTNSFTAIWAKGRTSLEPIAGQTDPVLKVSGTSSGTSDYRAEIIDDSTLSPQALKVQGDTHFWRGGNLVGRLQPNPDMGELQGVFAINHGAGPESPADRTIVIGQTASNPVGGNDTLLNSRRVTVGGGSPAISASDEFPVSINGPIQAHGTTPIDNIAIKTVGVISGTGIELPPVEQNLNEIQIGKKNRPPHEPAYPYTTINIGEGAGQTGQDLRGSQVNIRGDVNIQAGDTANPGDLLVAGQITANGNLHANAFSFLQGAVDMSSSAHVAGNFSADGTSTLNGNVTVGTAQAQRALRVHGTIYSDSLKSNAQQEIDFRSPVHANETLEVRSTSTFNALTAHLGGINLDPVNETRFTGLRKQEGRFDVYVDGILVFYFDSHGGHNA